MKPWRIEFTHQALKDLEDAPHRTMLKIIKQIRLLARDPSEADIEKLKTVDGVWRMRVDVWRVFFSFLEKEHIIRLLKLSDRKDAY